MEFRLGAEDGAMGLEGHFGATPVRGAAELFEPAFRLAALIDLPIELAAARDLDFEALGEGIDHRDADAMQAAGRLVDLGVKLAARMERAHDDFERRFLGKFRIDRKSTRLNSSH